ncbi:hypothetical protein D3C81_2061120 [compost metagenome]
MLLGSVIFQPNDLHLVDGISVFGTAKNSQLAYMRQITADYTTKLGRIGQKGLFTAI